MRHSRLLTMDLVTMLFLGVLAPIAMAEDRSPVKATMSFGEWQTDPPLDRFPPSLSHDRLRNEHQLIPHNVNIKAGGAVNFIISGFHQPIVYDDGIQPADIKTVVGENTTTTTGPTPSPAVVLIDDPDHRIYRGQDPSLQPLERASRLKPTPEFLQDRVEAVWFPKPGTYLVICGVHGHFVNDGMFGFVKVEAEDDD